MKPDAKSQNGIGTLQETSLHSALKAWYARPGDRFEVFIDGFYIDIVRSELLIEIQTRNFSAIKNNEIAREPPCSFGASHRCRKMDSTL
jgi:hypothetical protein